MNEKEIKKVSKFLSLILRHKPETIGLVLDAQGWAEIDALIAKSKNVKLTRELLSEVVQKDNKQRYSIEADRIRANQGHSVKIDLELQALVPPKILYHGTATRFLESIMKHGLRKQQRHHVHLSVDQQTAIKVGTRHGNVVLLEIDALKMHEEGHEFYLSANGVWLCERVPVGFIGMVD